MSRRRINTGGAARTVPGAQRALGNGGRDRGNGRDRDNGGRDPHRRLDRKPPHPPHRGALI